MDRTMNALVVDPSGTDRPRWSPVARAEAQAGDVLVRITAVGLAWGDVLQAQGKYSGGPSSPFVPGHEFVGEVVGFGDCQPSVDYAIGDRIFGLLPRGGALADLVAAPATWFDRVPAHLTDAEAAAVPSSFFTADAALFTMGRLDAGEVVVVQAAAGGFGSAAVQLAHAQGAREIIGTAGSANRRDFARSLGATAGAGYDDLRAVVEEVTDGRGADLALESVGGEAFDSSLACLGAFGRLVTVGASSGAAPNRIGLAKLWFRSLSVMGLHLTSWIEQRPELVAASRRRVLDVLTRRDAHPVVGAVFDAADITHAYDALSDRQVMGRAVVTIGDGR
jgi:NADPH:quinone reductase